MPVIKNYLSLIKFSHTIFAMPFAFIGFFLGLKAVGVMKNIDLLFSQSTNQLLFLFLLVILCMVFARSAAMAFNRYLDKNFDARNPRTAIREIPNGVLKAENVLFFTIINCLLFITTTFFINRLCFYLSPVALLVVLGYSYTKRFTSFCHLILGLGLSLAPIGSYLAVTGRFDLIPVLFSFTVLFWVSGFDIIYSLQDEEFDKENNLYSMPAAMGKARALSLSKILHLLSITCVVIAGLFGGFGWLYWTGAIIFTGMLIYQHSIVKPDDLKKVNIAFMTANGIASVVFAIFVITDLFFNS